MKKNISTIVWILMFALAAIFVIRDQFVKKGTRLPSNMYKAEPTAAPAR